jgi:hypothetical protein
MTYPSSSPDAPRPANSALAIWSLVLGVLSVLCFTVFTGIPAVICGHMARGRIKRSPGTLGGDGMALAGLITGYLGIAWGLVFIPMMLAIAIPNFARARSTAFQAVCQMNVEQIEAAKQMWAVEHKKGNDERPSEKDLQPYLKNGALPVCPEGGTYTLNAVTSRAACSKHGTHP